MTESPPSLAARIRQAQQVITRPRTLLWLSAITLALVMGLWLAFTPGGILGKADAVGFAVCHQIEARSFLFPDGRALPLCARCSGTFLGVLVGLFGPALLRGRRHAGGFPATGILVVLLVASALWAFDGANSYLHLIPREGLPRLYSPTNFLRLTTGMFHGITMGSLILPVVNATLWADASGEPTLRRWWELAALYGAGVLLILMVLSGAAVWVYPLSILSAMGVMVIMTAIMMVMVTTLLGLEGAARTVHDIIPLAMLGLAAALVFLGGIDAVRLVVFGSWDGFDLSSFQ